MDAEVVVVGAGLAGLATARRLAAAGVDVRVLEARTRVGGRTLSQALGADTIDLGGQWVGPDQRRVRALAEELSVRTFPQHHHGTKVLELGGRRRTFEGTIPGLDLVSLLDLQRVLWTLDRLGPKVPPDRPWESAHAAAWDDQTVAEWARRHVLAPRAREMLAIATRAIFAVEPEELSFLFFLTYLSSGGGLLRMASVDGGAQQDRLVGGAQSLSLRMAEALGDRVRTGAVVTRIAQDEGGVTVTAGDLDLRARRLVLAIPPALTGRIAFDPALPPRRAALAEEMPMGSAIKFVAAYERPFWRHAGLSGEAVSDVGPVRLALDDSSHDGAQAALVGFFLGDTARRFSGRPEERRAAALASLARFFGEEARHPTHYVDQDWLVEEHSLGCYVGVMGKGALTRVGEALRAPFGRLHFAGTETAREWVGYFDGALESAERVSREVLGAL